MKILHTSDWHLGASAKELSLVDDQRFFIDDICRIIKEKNVDAVMIAGDIYDRSVSSTDAVNLYDYAMTRMINEIDVPVFTIAGNHDSAERLSNLKDVLAKNGLHIVGSLSADISPITIGDAEIFMLPWITEERVKSVFPEKRDGIKSIEDAYKVVTDAMREKFSKDKKHIIISHAFITNCETSTSDKSAVIGFASQVSASVFEGFDYVALGHLHKPQDVNEKTRYSGTPMAYSFGEEEKHTKSVTIIDTSDMSKEIVPINQLHIRKTISGTYDEVINSGLSPEECNGYLRIEINDKCITTSIISNIKSKYPNYVEVAGKTSENQSGMITLSVDELEKMQDDPIEVLKSFCKDELNGQIDKHLIELFEKAVKEVDGKEELA